MVALHILGAMNESEWRAMAEYLRCLSAGALASIMEDVARLNRLIQRVPGEE